MLTARPGVVDASPLNSAPSGNPRTASTGAPAHQSPAHPADDGTGQGRTREGTPIDDRSCTSRAACRTATWPTRCARTPGRASPPSPKTLPPKWFYDERGSELFEKITQLPEYYPTRAERAILAAVAAEIAAATGASTLVELGSGSSEKTRLLLDALRAAGSLRSYVPVDVSESALIGAAHRVLASYPGLTVDAVVADFRPIWACPRPRAPAGRLPRRHHRQPAAPGAGRVPGPAARGLRAGDALLLGTDLVKDPAVLLAAYDDAAGVTAAFNKNVLAVLNRELGADFDLDAFDHVALWDPQARSGSRCGCAPRRTRWCSCPASG